MIKLTTMCPNIATVLTLAVLLTNNGFAQEPGSILQLTSPLETSFEPQLAIPEAPGQLAPEDLNVLTRGPLHEAFASAHQSNPQSSALVSKTPPEAIDEIAPEYQPEGNNVQWISGYWAWDDAQSDFIWISGIWRDVPPNRKWMPGYWSAEGNAHRWVSGFWTEETQLDVGYLPQPPASIDQGPSTVAPSEEHFYVPGNWQFQNDTYRWLAGHWQPVVADWIWVPAQYVWTPNGCVYRSGYWDYELQSRGTCFAPVQFTQPVYLANNYHYRPSYAIDLNIDFMTHLFVRPRCGHYFYGDWYASNYNNVSYRPWVSYTSHFRNYDPLLTYYRCRRSSFDSRYNVVQYLARQHSFYNHNRDYRPRPTYSAQRQHATRIQLTLGNQGRGKDYLRKSSYVRTYNDLRNRDQQRRKQTAQTNHRIDQQRQQATKHRKVAEIDQRNHRRQAEQLADLQRERQRREREVTQRVAKNSSANTRTRNFPSTTQHQQERLRQAKEKARQTANAQRTQSRNSSQANQFVKRQPPSQSHQSSQSDRIRRAQQEQTQRTQQANNRRVQEDVARRAQQDSARRAQQESARKAQLENARRAQQQAARTNATKYTSGKLRMQNIPSIKQREAAARKAQQDQARQAQQANARRVQQDAARKAQQEQARRAQQERSRQQAARQASQRASQQQSQRDDARKAQEKARQDQARRTQQAAASRAQQDQARRVAQQKSQQDRSRQQAAQRAQQQQSQRDAARKAQQKTAQRSQANKQRSSQPSRSSRLRTRSSKK